MARTDVYSRQPRRRPRAAASRRKSQVGIVATGLVVLMLAAIFGQSTIEDALSRIGVSFDFGSPAPTSSAVGTFALCGSRGPHANCVIDGDTFYLGSESIRVADIDTPETHPARCPYEAELGEQATVRLAQLLSAGPFDMALYDSRDADQYGRKLRVVSRNGRSLGDQLVAEGLAREWSGSRQPWCA